MAVGPSHPVPFSWLASLAAFSLLSQGCSDTPSDSGGDSSELGPPVGHMDTGCEAAEPSVLVGGGAEVYEPLNDGDPATIVHGPQGGWHMLASARVSNTLDIVTITYTTHLLPEETSLSWNQYRVQLQLFEECTGDYPGMYGYLDVSALAEGEADTPPELLEGRELRLSLQVTDTDGHEVEASVVVVGELDPVDG